MYLFSIIEICLILELNLKDFKISKFKGLISKIEYFEVTIILEFNR